MIHLSLDEMLAYVQNRNSPEARLRMAAHLQQCAFCRRELAVIRETLANEKHENLADLPLNLTRRVLAAIQRRRSQDAEPRHLPIQLQYDSRIAPVVPGIRGYVQDRQILFSSAAYDIDLHIFNSGTSQFSLQGQILPQNTSSSEKLEGIRVLLNSEEITQRIVISDELGRFFFSDLAQGVYTLTVELPEGQAQFQPLQIG